MAWTTPKTWVSEPLTALDLNTHVRDNLDYLKNPPATVYNADESSNYQVTSTASFVPVDSTNLDLTLTTAGGDVLIGFLGMVTLNASGAVFMDVLVDGVSLGGDDGLVMAQLPSNNGQVLPLSFVYLATDITPNTEHTFSLVWRVSTGTGTLYAGAGTSLRDFIPQFWVREV